MTIQYSTGSVGYYNGSTRLQLQSDWAMPSTERWGGNTGDIQLNANFGDKVVVIAGTPEEMLKLETIIAGLQAVAEYRDAVIKP